MVILRGLPASGKSTWAKAWRDAVPGQRLIVGRDQIRHDVFGCFRGLTQLQEDTVTEIEVSLVAQALLERKSVVIDDTNVEDAHLAQWTDLAARLGVRFEIVTIDTPLDECLVRNRERGAAGGRFVPEEIIEWMHELSKESIRA